MIEQTDDNNELENWCGQFDSNEEGRFYERIKSAIVSAHHYHFNIYLRRRLPDNSLEKVRMWSDELPDIDVVALAFGGGIAVLDFEVLFGRQSGKKKRAFRQTFRFDESWDEKKRMHESNRALKQKML
ncbi:MAG: hypothetical protein ABSF80_07290 [Chitinispirillaceae bacterium]|jgi:hypothetical protein